MSQYRPDDEINNQASSGMKAGGKYVANKAKKAIGKKARKAATNVVANLAKNGLVGVLKGLGTAVLSLLAPFLPFIIGALAILILVSSIFTWWEADTYNDPAGSGAFQFESSNQDNTVIRSETSIDSIKTSLGNDIAGIFYTKYAKNGYFYTLDENPAVIQGDLTDDIKDFEGREAMFLLSPQMLMALDNGLNDGYKIPEQFIKPVYNSCMTDDVTQKTNNGYCRLLNLTEKGVTIAKSNAYIGKYYKADDVKPAGIDAGFSGYLYTRSEEKTGSVYDWGLAPIFHYKTFTESSRVSNYGIQTVEVFNETTKKIETKNYADLSEAEKAAYPTVSTTLEYGSSEDKSKSLRAPTTKYAIDNVVSFLGTIKNSLTQEWIPQGEFKQVSYITKNYYVNATEAEIANLNINKKVCSPSYCREASSVIWVEDALNPSTYLVQSSATTVETMEGVTSIEVNKVFNLAYTKVGVLELNTVKYENNEPETSGIVGAQYLSDYIDLYQTYLPVSGNGAKAFACYAQPTFEPTLDWDTVVDNSSFSASNASSLATLFDEGTPVAYVSSPAECTNNTIAKAVNSDSMDKFYFDEIPNMHYLVLAKLLNYQLDTNDENQLVIDNTLNTLSHIAKPNLSTYMKVLDTLTYKYGDFVKQYANTYGVDENLLYAIMMTSDENDDTTSQGCSTAVGSGCGIMMVKQADSESLTFTAVNHATGQIETISLDESKLVSSAEYNIKSAAAQLQYLMKKYKNNLLAALEAYNSTTRNVATLFNSTHSKVDNMKDISWTALRPLLTEGNPTFLEEVLSNTVSDILQFNMDKQIVRVDIAFLRTVNGTSTTVAIRNLNQSLIDKYFTDDGVKLADIWNILFVGQKDYDTSRYSAVQNGYPIDTTTMSDTDKDYLIRSVFAYSEGKPIENYENINADYWRTKARSLFLNSNAQSMLVFYDAQKYIDGPLSDVVPTSSFLVVTREYGKIVNVNGGVDAFEDVEYQTMLNGSILSITDGTITEIIKGKDGRNASITIAANPVTKTENGVKVVEYQSKIYYTNLKEITSTLKVGDAITSGTVIGKVTSENDNKFNLAYYVNGESVDANLILEYFDYAMKANAADSGIVKNRSNAAYLAQLKLVDFTNLVATGSANWFNPVGGGRKTGGTWRYEFRGGSPHDAVDIARPVGTPIQALGDGVLIDYVDSTPDYTDETSAQRMANPTPVNYALYAMVKDGSIYTVKLVHIKQNSVSVAGHIFKEGDVIAQTGDNGVSTGAHLHMSVINHGSNTTIQAVIDKYMKTPGYTSFGIDPKNNFYQRCENTSSYPCGFAVDKAIYK